MGREDHATAVMLAGSLSTHRAAIPTTGNALRESPSLCLVMPLQHYSAENSQDAPTSAQGDDQRPHHGRDGDYRVAELGGDRLEPLWKRLTA